MGAALFHEQHAADLGVKEAIVTMSKIYLGMPRDVLVNCTVEVGGGRRRQSYQYTYPLIALHNRSTVQYNETLKVLNSSVCDFSTYLVNATMAVTTDSDSD